jgi:hypothetical protein
MDGKLDALQLMQVNISAACFWPECVFVVTR